MCKLWQLSALSASWWAAAWVSGWVTGWQTGFVRNARSLSQTPTLRLRTPISRIYVETLKLNPNAGQHAPRVTLGSHLRRVK